MSSFTRCTVPALLALLSACFSYTPLEPSGPEPRTGAPVRASLKTPGSFRLTDITVDNVVRVEGEFVGWRDGGLTLSATWLKAWNGRAFKGIGETIVIPVEQLDQVERRVVSGSKSAGLLGLGALVGVLANVAFAGGAGGTPPGGTTPPTK